MTELFNSRELASAIWISLFAIWAATFPDVRKSFGQALQALLNRHVLRILVWTTSYVVAMIVILSWAGFWSIANLKITIYWFLSAAIVTVFRSNQETSNPNYFRHTLSDNFNLVVMLEYVVNFHSFNILAELLIFPAITMIVMVQAFSEGKKKYENIQTPLNVVLTIYLVSLLVHAIYRVSADPSELLSTGALGEFLLPPVFSILFLPFMLLLLVYFSYGQAFSRIRFSVPDELLEDARRISFRKFRGDRRLLLRWARIAAYMSIKSKGDLIQSINDAKYMKWREEHPSIVTFERGWAPGNATRYLSKFGLVAGDYDPSIDGIWTASSEYLPLKDESHVLCNNIAYYVYGDRARALHLKLKLNVNEPAEAEAAHEMFLEFCDELAAKALGRPLDSAARKAVITRVAFPVSSPVFGTLSEIAYTRTVGSPYGPATFDSQSARFVLDTVPLVSPDSVQLSSLSRRMITSESQEYDHSPFGFDKPSNSLFIPPEYFSVNCYICVANVNDVKITVDGSELPTTVNAGENVRFDIDVSGLCALIGEGAPGNATYDHLFLYGDGNFSLVSKEFNGDISLDHTYSSGGAKLALDDVECSCSSLFSDSDTHIVNVIPPAPIEINLTFDDGPHGSSTGNRTLMAVDGFQNNTIQPNAKGAFFIQTHVSYRLPTAAGTAAVEQAIANGHEIGIHTGGTVDHEIHPQRVVQMPYAVPGVGDSGPDGQNALESDMIAAKIAIDSLAGGTTPTFVRAPELEFGTPSQEADILATYARQGLTHAGIDVQGDDAIASQSYTNITAALDSRVSSAVQAGDQKVVVLLHDVRENSVLYLKTNGSVTGYFETMRDAVLSAGNYAAQFNKYSGD